MLPPNMGRILPRFATPNGLIAMIDAPRRHAARTAGHSVVAVAFPQGYWAVTTHQPVPAGRTSRPPQPKGSSMARLAQTEGLTDVQQEILSTVKSFVDKEILPYATDLEHKDEFPEAIVEGMKEMGLFGLMIPEEYGGLGESLLTYALVVEQIARGWMSVSGVINTHFIVAYMITQHGTDEQKQRLLPKMAAGEVRGAFSMSEPELGSDVAAIKTRATADGDEFVLDGQKMWLTNGARAGVVATLVKDDLGGDSVYKNMTTFLIEKEPGF